MGSFSNMVMSLTHLLVKNSYCIMCTQLVNVCLLKNVKKQNTDLLWYKWKLAEGCRKHNKKLTSCGVNVCLLTNVKNTTKIC